MKKDISYYEDKVKKCLEHAGKYTPALDLNIFILAGALQSLAIALDDISKLKSACITIQTARGEVKRADPTFKIAREAEENCRKHMIAIGLDADGTRGKSDADPLAELMGGVRQAFNKGTTRRHKKPAKASAAK